MFRFAYFCKEKRCVARVCVLVKRETKKQKKRDKKDTKMLVYSALNLLKKGMAFREDKKKMKIQKKKNHNNNIFICTIYYI